MKISSINSVNTSQKKGKIVGSGVGAGVGTVYMLKNGKDYFRNGIENTVKQLEASGKLVSKPVVNGIKYGVPALVILAATFIGRFAGGLIGKAIDKIKAKKADAV